MSCSDGGVRRNVRLQRLRVRAFGEKRHRRPRRRRALIERGLLQAVPPVAALLYHAALRGAASRGSSVSRETVEVETGPDPAGSVIWLHGLGADGHDFEPIVPELIRRGERALRFVFPHAPIRPVTLNNGYAMRAWYDIVSLERRGPEDETGIRASQATIEGLIRRENERGVPTEKIVLAGFSQGGALALVTGTRYPQKLAGIMALSCYLLLANRFNAERSPANQATPIFLAHGLQDAVVAPVLGEQARAALQAAGYSVEWHTYSMPHSVCPQEVADIAAWLRRVL
jgi:phospholipase/carboxylesterase